MRSPHPPQHTFIRRVMLFMAPLALLWPISSAFGQQEYVTRFDGYVGYSFLDSPHVSLFENGFAAQIGVRPKTWYSLGFDYSISSGNLTLTPNLLVSSLQQSLAAALSQAAPILPPGYTLVVPTHSRTQTFAAGPQLAFRHWRHETIFWRPLFAGAIYEVATPQPKPGDAFAAGVVKQLLPSGSKTDTTWFLGVGGGIDYLVTKHFALRTQVDVVYDHLFSDLLADGRWTVRFSVGPAFNFGQNIKK